MGREKRGMLDTEREMKLVRSVRDLDIYQIILNILRKHGNESADVLTSKAMRWIAGNKSRPFFLWLHYFDVHAPYRPPRNFSNIFHNDGIYKTGRHLPILPMEVWNSGGIPDFIVERNINSLDYYTAQYDGAIRFTDEQIGRLLTYFKREGLAENTVFILTADHGEYLGEHDFMSHTGFPLDIVMKVPLIMRYGDLFEEKKVDFQTQSIDIVPTNENTCPIFFKTHVARFRTGRSIMSHTLPLPVLDEVQADIQLPSLCPKHE